MSQYYQGYVFRVQLPEGGLIQEVTQCATHQTAAINLLEARYPIGTKFYIQQVLPSQFDIEQKTKREMDERNRERENKEREQHQKLDEKFKEYDQKLNGISNFNKSSQESYNNGASFFLPSTKKELIPYIIAYVFTIIFFIVNYSKSADEGFLSLVILFFISLGILFVSIVGLGIIFEIIKFIFKPIGWLIRFIFKSIKN